MPLEIERKFLVADEGWRRDADEGRALRQAYLADTGRAAVRVRIEDGARAWLTIKSADPGLTRQEFEYPVPLQDGEALLSLRQGSVVEKTRFLVPHGGHRWEVDVYAGDNEGLVIAEVEIESEGAAVDLPPWLGPEVSGDPRYYASSLARHPFRAWAAERASG
jgi:adenylate cyclase